MVIQVQREIAGRTLVLETGLMAKQAHGSVTVRYGDSMILATAVRDEPRPGIDFFPLTVDYREKTYSSGRIPGGYFKREGRPSEKEILTMRLIDRPMRPMFPDGFRDEVQVMVSVLSADESNDPDIISMIVLSPLWRFPRFLNGPLGAFESALNVSWCQSSYESWRMHPEPVGRAIRTHPNGRGGQEEPKQCAGGAGEAHQVIGMTG
jgi:polyribonucleotide nucleotidyltransferase